MSATYRLQLNAAFTLHDARAIVPYLASLGITHLYLSPIMQAAPGSTHGYDVIDSNRVSEELGGEAAFSALVADVAAHGLHILLDIVPNHMSIAGARNAWWRDVLENGSSSRFAHFFDIDWSAGVTLPVLGERYGRALANGTLRLAYETEFSIRAGDERYPVAPASIADIVRRARGDREAILAEVAAVNSDKAALDALLEAQVYRLVHWSVSTSELGYRRFFDVDTLIGLRIEDLDVFEARHERVLQWLRDGTIAGVRIDHVDGLRDPTTYLERLRERAPGAWIVVEKILAPAERLPEWPIDGTTGYDAMERIGGLLVDPAGEAQLTALFEELTGAAFDPDATRREARREIMGDALHSEISRLVDLVAGAPIAATRDYTRAEIRHALVEIIAGYRVYRTYGGGDRQYIEAAVRAATGLDPDLAAVLELALAGEIARMRELASVAQQVTGAVVAKGDEDTAGYRLARLASRCEVGADLDAFAISPKAAHRAFAAGLPGSLVATTTHDAKRGEDTRARLSVLSEVPDAWRAFVVQASERGAAYWGDVSPDRAFEYLMWQTFVGAWPLSTERALAYATKAAREMRTRTSWRSRDLRFEAAMATWVAAVLADRSIVEMITRFIALVAERARASSLAQLLIKLVAPGVPDIYQGCELADYSLVDPDNRAPVDYAARAVELDEIPVDVGLSKLWTIRRVLRLRGARPDLFAAPYAPLFARGPREDRVFAFSRGEDLIAVVPRAGAVDPATEVPLVGAWHDVLSDRDHRGTIPAAELWRRFPIALLVRSAS